MKKTLIFLLLAIFVCSCSNAQPLAASEGSSFLDAANPMAENLLVSLQNQDFESFIKDMDLTMRTSITEESFFSLRKQYIGQYGNYQSHEFLDVAADANFVSIYYKVNFETKSVRMQVVLPRSAPKQIAGLWFK